MTRRGHAKKLANSSSNGSRGSKEKTATQQRIKQNVDFLIQQLEAAHSDALTAYLTAMSRIHSYSFGNIFLSKPK